MLKAGVALKDISPEKGIELSGYPHYARNNTGVHDPLYAACMYLNNGTEEIAMVTLDLLIFSKGHVAKVREKVEAACGIPGSHIMISASHTHSGPQTFYTWVIEDPEVGDPQPMEYVNWLIDQLVDLIVTAKNEAFHAEFLSGYAICGAESGVGGNRMVRGGIHDPRISVMAVRDSEKVVRGIFTNYTLHPTFIHEWSTVCTADYPAYIRVQLNELEEKAVIGFSQGASGNQSSRYFRQGEDYDEAERVGRTLGKAAYTVIEKGDWKNDIVIKIVSSSIDVEIRDLGSEEELIKQVEEDKKVYKELYAKYGDSKNRDEYYLWQNANLKLLGSEDRLGLMRLFSGDTPPEIMKQDGVAEVQVIRIDDTCVVGVPGEVFVEYAIYVKAVAGFKTVIFNHLTNGALPGYLYTPEGILLGGYEVNNSMVGEEFGMHLVDEIITNIKKIK